MADFDAAVVGSSPLMLLVALDLRKKGRSVVVLDRDDVHGGVWGIVHTAAGLDVEYACHLIEEFPGVYEYLANASGTPFVPLDIQPVRVLRNGRRVLYSSRMTILMAFVFSLLRIVTYRVRARIGRATEAERERDVVFRQKVADFVRHHHRLVIAGPCVQGPLKGHAEFVRALLDRCVESGVVFQKFGVVRASDVDGQRWELERADGGLLTAAEIHCTTSAGLTQERPGHFVGSPVVEMVTRSIVVRVASKDVVDPVVYSAFWDDPDIVRTSRIDRPVPLPNGQLFLVQLGNRATEDAGELARVVERALLLSGIIHPGAHPEIVEEVASKRVPHTHQIPQGAAARSFRTYSSAGNLASGVARWLREESK